MKYCSGCSETKPEKDFDWLRRKNNERQPKCKQCRSKYFKEYYKKNRKRYRNHAYVQRRENQLCMLNFLADKKCLDCKETDPVVLQFDHRDPKMKKFNVSAMLNGFSWPAILNEIKKCDIRCANCHIKKTARTNKWYRALAGMV